MRCAVGFLYTEPTLGPGHPLGGLRAAAEGDWARRTLDNRTRDRSQPAKIAEMLK